jgi:hypothetical protein
METVYPGTFDAAFDAVKRGCGIMWVRTYTKNIRITAACLARWESIPGKPLIRVDGSGFRLRSGSGSVYVLPGYLLLEKV